MTQEEILIGSIEAGGTKMICAVGTIEGKIIEEVQFPTLTPPESIPKMLEFFKKFPIKALGIATFGPVVLDKNAPNYGCLTTKIKPGWQNFSYLNAFKELNVPIGLDTDVNGSCIGEMSFGAAKGLKNVVYITIGTGIGIGVCSEGNLVHGIQHPEGGHIYLSRREDDKGKCVCPYHNSCFEGLAGGPSLQQRYNLSHEEMQKRPEIWDLEAYYIAQAILSYIYIVCPQRIILGGGVMQQTQLYPLIRQKLKEVNNEYYSCAAMDDLDSLIVPESLKGKQGILGGITLGYNALKEASK